ncbi:hypothetical protein LSAT2_026497 [Lamellibrachia satsuma]|nr:hypothetical protein LSAT2_026497 [Lamellibrachia satsuma]
MQVLQVADHRCVVEKMSTRRYHHTDARPHLTQKKRSDEGTCTSHCAKRKATLKTTLLGLRERRLIQKIHHRQLPYDILIYSHFDEAIQDINEIAVL